MKCPKCNRIINAVSAVTGFKFPGPDDFSICAYCDTILQFNEDMSLRIAQNVPSDVRAQYEEFLAFKRSHLN